MSQRVDLIISCVNNTNKALQEITSSFQGLAAKVAVWNYSFQSVAGNIGKAYDLLLAKTVATGDALYKMSQRTGMSVEALYELKSVAESSDIGFDEMGMAIGALSRNLLEAKTKAGDARAIFQTLGIDTAKPLGDVIKDLAVRFSQMRDGEDKMALSMQLFGRSGSQIIPVLNDIAQGGQNIAKAFSEESALAANKFSSNIGALKRNMSELTYAIGNELMPTLNKMFDVLNSSAVKSLAPIFNAFAAIGLVNKGINKALDYTMGREIPEVNAAIAPGERKSVAPKITTESEQKQISDDRRKWMEWEWQYADTVDKAGQEILDNLDKRDKAEKEHARTLQAAREAEIQLQIKEIDLSQQNLAINKPEATRQRVQLYKELQKIQEEYLAGLDKEKDPASWYAQQNAINETRQALVELNLAMKEQFGTLSEGMVYGFGKYMQDANTAFQSGAQFAKDAAQAMHDSFQQVFFDGLQLKFKSLGDYFKGFLKTIQQAWAKAMADMMSKAMGAGFDWLGGLLGIAGAGLGGGFGGGESGGLAIFGHSGGRVSANGIIPRFHAGGLSGDEVPAILQRGEYVVSRRGVDMLDKINNGQFGGGKDPAMIVQQTVNFNVSSLDGQDSARVLKNQAGTIRQIVSEGIQQSRTYASQIRGG
ncbi:hypothetical protein BIY37_04810 [Candidatus Brocadia sapporoensis]|uniref:Bacteriophage tail tape measure C-terminal domain-containing protein n=1 Tax=Candidatus Brocadia sapporoensis TaxID=392547 RepID=A0A1V6M1A4_9BACT|nr:hypothetical protein [Candidatus Brocadia sapporoensis]OQD46145.1 hypothetical protein BIY37_04810 [Candidatus Brocadia sapporoensis]GJQ23571.1 MAG: hypothetical protein HBSAPP01_13610 [Candidatus Brocadia sapporoensis]